VHLVDQETKVNCGHWYK